MVYNLFSAICLLFLLSSFPADGISKNGAVAIAKVSSEILEPVITLVEVDLEDGKWINVFVDGVLITSYPVEE